MSKVELPEPWPKPGDSRERHAAWVSKATLHNVVASWRAGRTQNSALVIRLGDGHEMFFETVAEACRPERFITAFLGADGIAMPNYGAVQVRELVAALVRMASMDREEDDRDEYASAGADYLRACLGDADTVEIALGADDDDGRLHVYRTAIRYANLIRRLRGDPHERLPALLHATDLELLHVPRGLYLSFARRRIRGVTVATFNAQMRRVGWNDVDLRPRKPLHPDALRPNLRLWQIEDGWDGIAAGGYAPEDAASTGPMVPPGLSGARASARDAAAEVGPGGAAGPVRFPRQRRGDVPGGRP